jgi:VanZ family protein
MVLLKKYPFVPGILFFLITVFLFTLPGNAMPTVGWFNFPQRDKFIHHCLFFILGALFAIPVKYRTSSKQAGIIWLLLICLCCIGYGIAIEFIQKWWIANRSFEALDILADATGATAAFGYSYLKIIRKR